MRRTKIFLALLLVTSEVFAIEKFEKIKEAKIKSTPKSGCGRKCQCKFDEPTSCIFCTGYSFLRTVRYFVNAIIRRIVPACGKNEDSVNEIRSEHNFEPIQTLRDFLSTVKRDMVNRQKDAQHFTAIFFLSLLMFLMLLIW